ARSRMISRTRVPPLAAPNTVVVFAAAELMRMAGAVWLVESWYCTTFEPARKTALPAGGIAGKNEVVACWGRETAAIRAPPPRRRAPSAAPACQVDCWSLCDMRLAGRRTERFWYCALVVGTTSGPTLAAMARRP